jgi:hypothetical protein
MEYQMSQGNKTMYYIVCAVFSGLGVFFIYSAIHMSNAALLIPCVIFAGLGYLFYRMASRLRLTIDEYSITVCNGISTNSILLDEVSGFRRGDKEGIVLVRMNGEKPLSIPGTVERRAELSAFLAVRGLPGCNSRREKSFRGVCRDADPGWAL